MNKWMILGVPLFLETPKYRLGIDYDLAKLNITFVLFPKKTIDFLVR